MLNSTITPENYIDDWPYIPKEAFLYFPSQQQIHSGTGKTYTRRIFEGNVMFQEFEQKKIKQLDDALALKLHRTLMPWFTRANKLRFIQACKFDIDKTLKSVIQNNQWRLKTFPIQKNSFAETFIVAHSGAIYICGRDHCYRPIIVMDLSRFDTNNSEIQKPQFLSKILAVFFEFMINHMFIQGQVENYVMIINLNSLMMFAIGGIAKRLLQFTNNMYRGRLFMAYIVNTSSGISFFWKPVQSFLSENTLKKIILTDKPFSQQLFRHTNPSQIEQKYGGTLPNITSNFFPPRMHSLSFLLNSEQPQSKLVSESQYLDYFRAGKLQQRKICKQLVSIISNAQESEGRYSELARQTDTIRPFSPIKQEIRLQEISKVEQIKYAQTPKFAVSHIKPQSFQQPPAPVIEKTHKSLRNSYSSQNEKRNTFSNPPPNMNLLPAVVEQKQVLRRKESLEEQMLMDLQFIGANALGGTNSIVNIPVGDFPVHRTMTVDTFFQDGQYINMKKMFNPNFRS